jgi:transposase
MTLEKVPYVKDYQNKAALESYLLNGYESRDIAKDYRVSYKLINLWLLHYGLITPTSELALP